MGAGNKRLAKAGLIALMAIGSVMLWIGIPVGWLWIGSQFQSESGQASFGLYFGVLLGIVASMVVMSRVLNGLNGAYGRLAGSEIVRVRMPWHRSLRGEDEGRAARQILDVVMVISVITAGFLFLVWFLFFAGSSLPRALGRERAGQRATRGPRSSRRSCRGAPGSCRPTAATGRRSG